MTIYEPNEQDFTTEETFSEKLKNARHDETDIALIIHKLVYVMSLVPLNTLDAKLNEESIKDGRGGRIML